MTYANRIVVDTTTGQQQSIPVDDTWILANRPRYLDVSGPVSATAGVGIVITAQLKTPVLTSGNRNNVAEAAQVKIIIKLNGDTLTPTIALDSNGAFSDTVTPAYAGTLTIKAADIDGNIYSVQVT